MTKNQRVALKQLLEWDDIIVRKFDKGQGWVIDNPANYEQKMEAHLNDTETYEDITNDDDVIDAINQKITEWGETYSESGDISQKIATYVVKSESRPGFNYGNYKAHKPQSNYPLRLITSGCGSPVEQLSTFVEKYLHNIATSLDYVAKDSTDFLNEIEEFNSRFDNSLDNVTLVTLDITSMFPSIDNEMGIEACRELLNKRHNKFPSTNCIIDALKIILENNISYFNKKIYRQRKGSAIGPHHACSYADIAMCIFDALINASDYTLPMWVRFRDDIFIIWLGTIEELNKFHSWINTLHSNINFELNYNTESIEYLNCKVYKSDNKLKTTVFSKPSDTHSYLVPTSCHPTHIVKNIPYGVAITCRRICTDPLEFERHAGIYNDYFVKRGYDSDFVKGEFDRARNIDRRDLLGSKKDRNNMHSNEDISDDNSLDRDQATSSRNFPLVSDYNPKLPNISKALNKYKHVLDLDPTIKNFMDKGKIFGSFRRCKTLGDLLVNSRYPKIKHNNESKGCISCGKCTLCKNYLVATTKIESPHTAGGKSYNINQTISCSDDYVIYFILDKTCRKGYVGRTENSLSVRWATHKHHIKIGYDKCKVAAHWRDDRNIHPFNANKIDTALKEQLSITLIDKVFREPWDTADTLFSKLCKKEVYWQNQLCTLVSSGGLNSRDERNYAQTRTSKK